MNQLTKEPISQKAESIDQTTKLLLEQLEHQYEIYRDANRSYGQYAAASTTLLALLLLGVLTAARSDPRIYVLIPISLLWYGAILSLFISQSSVMAEYSELLEMKLNSLLHSRVFEFESEHAFPRRGKILENLAYDSSLFLAGLIPTALGTVAGWYGLTKGLGFGSSSTVWILISWFVILVAESCGVVYVRKSRGRDNRKRILSWEKEILDVNKSLNL